MLVRCRVDRGSELGPFRRGLFYTPDTRFTSLRVDDVYRVYGMSLFQETDLASNVDPPPEWYPAQAGLIILICNKYDNPPTLRPDWYPIELFSVEDPRLPGDWEFATKLEFGQPPEPKFNILARWGYPELVHSDAHLDGLVERDPKALAVFRTEYERREREAAGASDAE